MRRRRVQMGEAMPRPVPSERGVEWVGGGQAGLQSGTEGEVALRASWLVPEVDFGVRILAE